MVRPVAATIAPLFVPANRPDRFAKAAASEADAVIVDLEDAVAADAKAQARDSLRALPSGKPIIVRINGSGTAWHAADCAALAGLPIAAIMVPKAEDEVNLARLSNIAPIVALIETAHGLARARAIARSGAVVRLAFGSIDLAADLDCAHDATALLAARSELVLASRLGDLPPPLDGVTADLDRAETVEEDAHAARALGFGGKMAIHPSQIAAVLAAFRPTPDRIAWARRIVASGDGAIQIDGHMVDEPVRRRARAIVDRIDS